ncbi:MAG TPA: efflux RND transporter periplasmic adaptor subunit [Chthoniobacterales bacterium]|nr:efflux RND transporter periplasmic adaptor subunit [Chthoniobacterales bacterium]
MRRRIANFIGRHKIIFGVLFGVAGLFLTLVILGLIKFMQIRKLMAMPMVMPPTTVSSVQVKQEDWPPIFSSIGTISAVQGATVSAELAGTVAEVKFENGGVAKKGDVLVRLDASSEEAQLKSSEADLELARSNLARARDLASRNVVSKAELDAAESTFKQKEGVVNNMRSMISKKEVLAPFDGQLGIRQVNVGQTITAGQQVVSLQALDPLYVDFALPQQDLPKISSGLEVRVHTDVVPGREFPGKLTALNSSVDPITRNVTLQATIENKDHALRPGMFAKIDVLLPEKQKTLIVPGTAISYAPYGDSVFVIEKKKDEKTGKESQVLRQQFVRVGEARGDFVSITKGLEGSEQVVSTGVFKLRNGIPVVINNDLAPKPQLNPKPADT